LGQIGGVDVGNASKLKHLYQSPGIILRLKHKEPGLNEFVEISRLEALHLRGIPLDALLQWYFGLLEDQLVSLDGVVHQGLIVVDIGEIEDHGSTIGGNEHSFFIFGILVYKIAPDE
jgi:hypothetical protein